MKELTKREIDMMNFFEKKIEWFVPIKRFGKNAEIKKHEIGRIFGCSIIFNQKE